MYYYKDQNNCVHCLDSKNFENLLPVGCTEITAEEAAAINNPPLTLDQSKYQKIAELASYRWALETAGIMVNGSIIKTDEMSQAKLTGTWCTAQMNPAIVINWKGENGWVQITKTEIDAIALAVSAHVEACYTQEKVHYDAINLLSTPEDVEAYDITTGWPE